MRILGKEMMRVSKLHCEQFFSLVDSLSEWLAKHGVVTELDGGVFFYTGVDEKGITCVVDVNNPPVWLSDLVAQVIHAHWLQSRTYDFLNSIVDYLSLRTAVCVDSDENVWELISLDGVPEYVYGNFDGWHHVISMDEAISRFAYGCREDLEGERF